MSTQIKALVPGSVLTTSAVIYYQAPANTYAVLKQVTLSNTTGSAVTVTFYIVNDGSAPTAEDQLITAKALAPNECFVVYQANGQVLEPGYTIQALCSAGTSVTMKVSGIESV